jgi:hypothetical protein
LRLTELAFFAPGSIVIDIEKIYSAVASAASTMFGQAHDTAANTDDTNKKHLRVAESIGTLCLKIKRGFFG